SGDQIDNDGGNMEIVTTNIPKKIIPSTDVPSNSKSVMKNDKHSMESDTEKNVLECPECEVLGGNKLTARFCIKHLHISAEIPQEKQDIPSEGDNFGCQDSTTVDQIDSDGGDIDIVTVDTPKKIRPSSDVPSNSPMKGDKRLMEKNTEKNLLKCPECKYRSKSVTAWRSHLRYKHNTTPTLAGCLLRCDCGHESHSKKHSMKCEMPNFTLIFNGGPIRRLAEVTPQCVWCKKFPKTACGYIMHLHRHHRTTLRANDIYLKCACGLKYTVQGDYFKHDKKCTGEVFTLHKLDEE
ncbi:hypothetical protein PMAYCL1PPCAC_01550, partial [Pristionchus mayeri]